ncbi:YegP family protein [Lacinutrix algicola]|uniref:YegP family protein n=1 Tax=Lacinutrix algicola TaxID=342954 RepID=UPI0006E1BBFF|nr:YegP family protein [Lacinutrix algicola]
MEKFEVYQDSKREYRFRLKASNGQKILASEGYTAKSGCMNGIESVKTNSQDDSKFDRRKSSNGKHYFNLKASNGQIIGTSEMYEGSSGMENGINSVKTNAPKASIEDV